jgi:putative membrane protein
MARGLRGLAAGTAAVALVVYAPVTTAVAQDGAPVITNTETVNVSLDPAGNVDVARVYDQIAIQGSGPVSYVNPVSTAGLRNLDGFGGFTVEEGAIVEETTVDGQLRRRTVSDFELDLPVSVTVEYKLDGEVIEPGDLVGKSGRVEVTYTIENQTGEPEEITVLGADNRALTETQTVYDPLAGSLSLTLPPNYTDVVSDSGFLTAGDGRGGTLMTFSVTLIGGLTDPVAVGSYTAKVENAVIPPASLSIVPVLVEENPSSAAQLEALQGGADSGRSLASGAGQVDAGLLRLAKGSGDLVNGLILLRDGSAQLSDGLVNTAAPGSAQLADGAGQLADGLNNTAVPGSERLAAGAAELAAGLNGTALPGAEQLADGSAQVADGASELAAGLTGTAATGSKKLAAGAQDLADGLNDQLLPGAQQIAAGLQQLQGGVDGLSETVKAQPEYAQLIGALDAIIAQIGTPTDADPTTTVLGALNVISAQSNAGLTTDVPSITEQLSTIETKATGTKDLLDCAGADAAACGNLDDINAAVTTASGSLSALTTKLGTIRAIAGGLKPKLYDTTNVSAGCVDPPSGCGAAQILGLVKAGIGQLVDEIEKSINTPEFQKLVAGGGALAVGVETAAEGSTQVADGAKQLAGGLSTAAAGSQQLADGADQVADGNEQLASGLGDAADGSQQLADGAGQLSEGLVTAGDGASQVAEGNARLADGLGDAADGSVQIANGLEDAAEGAPAIPAGAQRLSDEGTSQIAAAGADTLVTFGQRVALLKAGAERTADGGLPFGAPEGALVAAAYRYDLAGASGTGSQNVAQLAGFGLIAGGAAAGAMALARRRAV